MTHRVLSAFVMVMAATTVSLTYTAGEVLALPYYSAREGSDCGSCHFDPGGGGPRNDTGFLFASQRNDFDDDPNPKYADLDLTNELADVFYFGTDTNGLFLFSEPDTNGTTISSFFQMQTALYATLVPLDNLAFVFSLDYNEFSGSQTRDAFGLIQDDNENFYMKLGRIRGAYGLRQFDHTAGIRAGFLFPATGGVGGFLPYDPRSSDTGIELGVRPGDARLSFQFTNGGAAFSNNAQAGAASATYTFPWLQVNASFYDRYQSSNQTRATRWGGFGNLRVPGTSFFLMGEIGWGTDDNADGTKNNLIATYVEGVYEISRAIRLRGKYDFSDTHRSEAGNASERFSIETDWNPIPFVDFKAGYRRLLAEFPRSLGDENQVFMLWYFYY